MLKNSAYRRPGASHNLPEGAPQKTPDLKVYTWGQLICWRRTPWFRRVVVVVSEPVFVDPRLCLLLLHTRGGWIAAAATAAATVVREILTTTILVILVSNTSMLNITPI